ncbi:MAG: GUN4 domain-containing protein [Leptolyngbyaceae cyanobacterium bins.349]|nr:GUN4 domain-containing protein [Leptolyngbyaceae cyanobacterium bins.349]
MPKPQKIRLFRDQLRNSSIARRRFLNWLFWGTIGVAGVTGCGLSSKHNSRQSSPTARDSNTSPVAPNQSNLEKLLQTQQWEAADRETSKLMWEVVRQNEEPNSPYDSESFNSFPCDVLNVINQLWVKHSQGKFGFSVQVKVWQEVGSPPTLEKNRLADAPWEEFGNRVGWRKEGSPVVDVFRIDGNPDYPELGSKEKPFSDYKEYAELEARGIVSLASPQGILPFGVFLFEGILERERTCGIIFSRVAVCRL